MKIKIIVIALMIFLFGIALIGVNNVLAQTSTPGPTLTIIQKLAQKFGLKESDVQFVFDQDRQDRQSLMQQRFGAKLSQDVTDKKITEVQKQAIIAKYQELQTQTNPDNWQTLTPEQRTAQMDQKRQESETWAKDNNIDLSYLHFGRGFGHFGAFTGKPCHRGKN